jgi:hypothetical protein
MPLMNFSQFISACIMFVLSKSNLECNDYSEDYDRVFKTCFQFLKKVVRKHTLDSLPRHYKYPTHFLLPNYAATTFDVMFENFAVFAEWAMQNIHIHDINTLCDGLKTQIDKFVKEYNFYINTFPIDSRDLCEYDYSPNFYYPSFTEVLLYIDMNSNYVQEKNEERQKVSDQFTDVEQKEMKTILHSKRVSGHRQDFEKHLFNKGLNKAKRERSVLKERKNKKFRDFRI